MHQIKVLGMGCSKCAKTVESITRIAQELNVEIQIEKIEDPQQIIAYGVMSTPAVVMNNVVVHAGSIPHRDVIEQWLQATN
ncbi:MAG: thioredoxin family protein [Gammaproteobacteria bacterium]|jgi:small redox-active disulfide protein 2|nr:thioredoxin family protein [Gammaproteobacteria bacterium]